MSWRASAWALKQRTGLAGAKLTLLAMASYANKDHVAWPSQQTLAEDTEQSVDSIQRHIRMLVQEGLISIERRRRRGDEVGARLVYRLNAPKPHDAAQPSRMVWPATANTKPHRAPLKAANGPRLKPQALRHDPLEPLSEPLEPQAAKADEGEPSLSPVTTYVRQREEEERRLTESRKQRPTFYQLKQRHGPTWGIKTI
jgi:DNA-binding transcriptional MocR family regulator